ncbi:hypothetical protein E3P92_03643 [Wallemia ichthyophaga]|nr:hypothetical protein E3P92_03643 [Wallemia ichthyophaga]
MSQESVADIGLIGLAVMGQNLILNMADKGYQVAAYNRTTSKVDDFLANEAHGVSNTDTRSQTNGITGKAIVGAHSIEEFCKQLKRPRKIILLVKAGPAVDSFIDQLKPFLEKGDIVIDAGNSHYPDSIRRTQELQKEGLLFVGSGVSGGEEGARWGPSIMPGGNPDAWPHIKEILQKTSAQVNGNEPCCDWVGDEGAGHYVKMVHNGIEYGDMQVLGEAYDILLRGVGFSHDQVADAFKQWNSGVLDSFLTDITAQILEHKTDGEATVDSILDAAGQKGTGKWTGVNALDLGTPVTLIAEAVFARCVSSLKDERQTAAQKLKGPAKEQFSGDKAAFVNDLQQALYGAKIISYAQGFLLFREAAKEYDWKLNNAGIAKMWRGGCIIKSVFLGDISKAYERNPQLESLLFDDFFVKALENAQAGWRRVVAQATLWGIPTPALSSSLSFLDSYRSADLPSASLIQAQRDFFGAHTFQVKDSAKSDKFIKGQPNHLNWTGRGGRVASSAYAA